ncbi:hypothetical protein [Variovorax paradoxus]|uniref:hypothetical protein n=1 Tax=Variovorax paradoxus TaxID=34073 RepID=UPI001ABCC0DB
MRLATPWIVALWLGALGGLAAAQATSTPPETVAAAAAAPTVAALKARREALFDARGIDLPALSDDLRTAVAEAERLSIAGDFRGSLDRLSTLRKYMPLEELPSFSVQALLNWNYQKLGDAELAQKHRLLAQALRTLLAEGIGKGDSADDPIRVVLNNEMVDWLKSRQLRFEGVRTLSRDGQNLALVSYREPTPGAPARQLFAQLDARTQAQEARRADVFTAVPAASLTPAQSASIALARQQRERFLGDATLPYLRLRSDVPKLVKAARALDAQGRSREALATLRELEAIRPIEDIPTPSLLRTYAILLGRTGEVAKLREINALLFGVEQVIAGSGDGKAPASAIHVLFIEEEYEWLAAKRLKPVRQSLRNADPAATYDVFTTEDERGGRGEVFFDITRLFAKTNAELDREMSKP